MNNPQLNNISMKKIFNAWWPLATSWLFMALELPALSATAARLAEPKINLAAYGGIVFPISLIIESPIIMLLAASTVLSKDWNSYRRIYRFMMITSGVLTIIHAAIVFTPLYYFVVEKLIGAPGQIIEPARTGLMIMLPWTWAIAYRRFNQGVLIRFGHSKSIGIGGIIRLTADGMFLALGYLKRDIPGIIIITSAVIAGVISEAIYVGIRVRPVLKDELKLSPQIVPTLSWREFANFYIPLAITSFMNLSIQPLVSSTLSRMPKALDSLAIWPVLFGLLFILRSGGIAFNEVVVSLLNTPKSASYLSRFAKILTITTTGIIVLVAATSLSRVWFEKVSALSPSLSSLAQTALWLGIFIPGANTLQSWYQGAILNSKKTRGVPEAVLLFLMITIIVFFTGILSGKIPGLYIGVIGYTLGMIGQTWWLWYRSRETLKKTYNQI